MSVRLLAVLILSLVAGAATAQTPSHDTYLDAYPITAGEAAPTFSTALAGHSSEPRPCGFVGRTLWFSWTAPANGIAVVDTAGSDFDTVVAAYDETPPRADRDGDGRPDVPCEDDGPDASREARLEWPVVSGRAYLLQAGGFAGASGVLRLRLDLRPVNDAFANALPVLFNATGAGVRMEAATTEGGERFACGAVERTVWYTWLADRTGRVAAHTFGSDADTVLSAYTGPSITSLHPVACDDDSRATEHSRVDLDVAAGTRYAFQVGTKGASGGTVTFVVEQATTNDDLPNARIVASLPYHHEEPTGSAGTSTEDPRLHGPPEGDEDPLRCAPRGLSLNETVWFKWRAPADGAGRVVADTFGSDHDTILAVYDHEPGPDSEAVACDDNTGPGTLDFASRVALDASNGTEYWFLAGAIRLDPDDRTFATLAFNLVQAPVHDLREDALEIDLAPESEASPAEPGGPVVIRDPAPVELPIRHVTSTRGAWVEEAPPLNCAEMGADVWYAFSPVEDGVYAADTAGSSFDTMLTVNGTAECSDDAGGASRSSLRFLGDAGNVTLLRVGGTHGATGRLTFTISQVRPSHDLVAAANTLVGMHARAEDDVAGATGAGEPSLCGASALGSVWYAWTAPDSREFVVDTLDSDFATAVAIWERSATGDRGAAVACGAADDALALARPRLRFNATLGDAYLFQIGKTDARADMDLLDVSVAPYFVNSARDRAAPIGPLPFTTVFESAGARPYGGEPAPPCAPQARAWTWFAWTPPDDILTTFDARGSDHSVSIAIYLRGASTPVACATAPALVRFTPQAGQEYEVQVADAASTSGETRLLVEARPPNDDFESAGLLNASWTGESNVTTLDTRGATLEPGEPRSAACGAPAATVWYSWTPAETRRHVLDTLGSEHDTSLAVFTGDTLASLNLVDCDDDRLPGQTWSRVVLDATAGTTYRIQVGGAAGATGDLVLTRARPPGNDDLHEARVQALDQAADVRTEAASTRWATLQRGEAMPCGSVDNTVWFAWTAPPPTARTMERVKDLNPLEDDQHEVGPEWIEPVQHVNASTFGSGFDTVLSVYEGPGGANVESADRATGLLIESLFPLVGCSDDVGASPQSRVEFEAQPGLRYFFQVGGRGGASGTVRFALNDAVLNDRREDANVLPALGIHRSQKFFGATADPAYPHSPDAEGRVCLVGEEYRNITVWYRWRSDVDGTVLVDTSGSSSFPVTAVYAGDASTPLRCGPEGPLAFPATAETEYWFQFVDDGPYETLKFSLSQSPANDVPDPDRAERLTDGA
ncbi:MAG TPA: hypothetical protein VI997_08575, partial [Candidatus Thermoplasmatota archaeon]|nr:hypothetical protein [Candidatus Thermoplasmatota archaeon]